MQPETNFEDYGGLNKLVDVCLRTKANLHDCEFNIMVLSQENKYPRTHARTKKSDSSLLQTQE